jgi:hypothetical protein
MVRKENRWKKNNLFSVKNRPLTKSVTTSNTTTEYLHRWLILRLIGIYLNFLAIELTIIANRFHFKM